MYKEPLKTTELNCCASHKIYQKRQNMKGIKHTMRTYKRKKAQ